MIHVAAAVATRNGEVLLASRPPDKPPAGWEFPGGKLEPGETPEKALVRELQEELAWPVTPVGRIYRLRKQAIIIDFIRVLFPADAVPVPREKQQYRWVPLTPQAPPELLANDLEFWDFLAADKIKQHSFPLYG